MLTLQVEYFVPASGSQEKSTSFNIMKLFGACNVHLQGFFIVRNKKMQKRDLG